MARLLSGDSKTACSTWRFAYFKSNGSWRGGTQRTDSTHILAAVRDLNRLEIVGETFIML
ncbi:MAG: hypothetical protein IPK53_19660 [bacterium]|nr:hypothetical protein [bacterium]